MFWEYNCFRKTFLEVSKTKNMYYKKSIEDIAQEFQVDTKIWLTDKQIKENQKKYGLNILTNEKS